MKQMETVEKRIGEALFYIKKFPAFYAANLSGELTTLLAPIISGIATLLSVSGDEEHPLDISIEDAIPVISSAFESISGDKLESLLRKLLINRQNVSVVCKETDGIVKVLDYDLANEVFCGSIEDMYVLAFYVIKENYNGFFEKLGVQSGNLSKLMEKMAPITNDTETST